MIGNIVAGLQDPGFVAVGDFESIATVTVGSGGAASAEFTSIGSGYSHLQIRGIARGTTSDDTRVGFYVQVNSDTGNNYSVHNLYGDGATISAGAGTSQPRMFGWNFELPQADATTNTFGAFVVDALDYANTSKNKTFRALVGFDNNGTTGSTGRLVFQSGLWMNTNAITSIKIAPNTGDWAQHSHFALYGIKG